MTVAKAPQKITFKTLKARIFGDADSSPGASASSGLEVPPTSRRVCYALVDYFRTGHIVRG